MRALAFAAGVLTATSALAQTPEHQSLLRDYNGMSSAFSAAAALNPHVNDSLNRMLEQATKDRAELDYWRKYVVGTDKEHEELSYWRKYFDGLPKQ